MKTNSFNQRLFTYDSGQDRYYDLLQDAEQYRLEQRAGQANGTADNKTSRRAKSPIAHLLMWTKSLIASY